MPQPTMPARVRIEQYCPFSQRLLMPMAVPFSNWSFAAGRPRELLCHGPRLRWCTAFDRIPSSRRVIVSSRFSTRLATIVHAAVSTSVATPLGFDSPTRTTFFAASGSAVEQLAAASPAPRRRGAVSSASGLRDEHGAVEEARSAPRSSSRPRRARARPARGPPRSAARRSSVAAPAAACWCGRGRRTAARGWGRRSSSGTARGGPLDEHVEAAAVERLAVVLQVEARVAVAVADRLPDVRRLVGVHAAAAHLVVHQPADEERVVAELLGVEAEARAAREQAVLGVLARDSRATGARRGGRRPTSRAASRASSCPSPSRYSAASQSSSSGWLGGSPCVPKSPLVFTSPMPKNCCQRRFDRDAGRQRVLRRDEPVAPDRAASGAAPASASLSGGSTAGTPGVTFSPGLSYWPRIITNESRGTGRSPKTNVPGIASAASAVLGPRLLPLRPRVREFLAHRPRDEREVERPQLLHASRDCAACPGRPRRPRSARRAVPAAPCPPSPFHHARNDASGSVAGALSPDERRPRPSTRRRRTPAA